MSLVGFCRYAIVALRYGAALAAVAGLGVFFSGTLYLEWLAVAIGTDAGLGGPLALPAMLLVALAFSLIYGTVVAAPLCLWGEWLLRRRPVRVLGLLWPAGVLAVLPLAGYATVLIPTDNHESPAFLIPLGAAALLGPPLTFWTVARFGQWLLRCVARQWPKTALYVLWPRES